MTTMLCALCGGELLLLGLLGRRAHLRCRDCGFDQSVRADLVADEEE